MTGTFGDARTIPASAEAKRIMKQLSTKGLFSEQRDVWRLGAALGVAMTKTEEGGKRDTFQNVNSLDPEEFFAAVMLGKYPDATPEERLKKLVDYAEWGIRELERKEKNGTLDFAHLAGLGRDRNDGGETMPPDGDIAATSRGA